MNEYLNEKSELNKLFCTFSKKENLEQTLDTINKRYTVLYNKIFILNSPQSDEYICTYNIDTGNVSNLLDNTILLHRKKDYNTLYTINALNNLIKSLNEGVLNVNYKINWENYKNCILLTNGSDVRKLDTTIHKIVNL